MIFKRKSNEIPDWVSNYPSKDNQATLIALIEAGADLSLPREMNFSIFSIPSESDTDNAVQELANQGWSCRADRQVDNPSLYLIDATKTGYIIDEVAFTCDKELFVNLAAKYNAEYDGWFASV